MEEIKTIFKEIGALSNWKMNLIKVKSLKSGEVEYTAEMIKKINGDGIDGFVKDIGDFYIEENEINKYKSIEEFSNSNQNDVLYELSTESELIKECYDKLMNAIAFSDVEEDSIGSKYNCYILRNEIEKDGKTIPVKLIFNHNPVKVLKHSFFNKSGKYEKIPGKVLTLKLKVDVIVFGEKVIFFNNSAEVLFNMQRTYKIICNREVKEIIDSELVSDNNIFLKVANFGHNPQKLLTFKKERLELLKKDGIRKKISEKFGIPIIENKFDTSSEDNAKKLLLVLCGKGTIDPFEDLALEVTGARKWNGSD